MSGRRMEVRGKEPGFKTRTQYPESHFPARIVNCETVSCVASRPEESQRMCPYPRMGTIGLSVWCIHYHEHIGPNLFPGCLANVRVVSDNQPSVSTHTNETSYLHQVYISWWNGKKYHYQGWTHQGEFCLLAQSDVWVWRSTFLEYCLPLDPSVV